jgi:hypothetical protein
VEGRAGDCRRNTVVCAAASEPASGLLLGEVDVLLLGVINIAPALATLAGPCSTIPTSI